LNTCYKFWPYFFDCLIEMCSSISHFFVHPLFFLDPLSSLICFSTPWYSFATVYQSFFGQYYTWILLNNYHHKKSWETHRNLSVIYFLSYLDWCNWVTVSDILYQVIEITFQLVYCQWFKFMFFYISCCLTLIQLNFRSPVDTIAYCFS